MAELELETACAGEANALIRRAVVRRMTVAWAAAEGRHSGVASPINALVEEMVGKTERFRHRYFAEETEERSGALGSFLRGNAPDLAEALHQYRIPDQVGSIASAALHRLRECGRLQANTDWLEVALSRSAGLTVRELLGFLHMEGPGRARSAQEL
jgi:hypothetical protein